MRECPDDAAIDKGPYQRLVGRLICSTHIRPDITYDVRIVSQFTHNPKETRHRVVNRIL